MFTNNDADSIQAKLLNGRVAIYASASPLVYSSAGNTTYINPAKMKYQMSKPAEERNFIARWQDEITWNTQIDQTALATNLVPYPGTDLADVNSNVFEIFLQVLSASATAKSDADVDSILDKAQKDAVSLGYNDLLEWRTEQWQKNKQLLGEE